MSNSCLTVSLSFAVLSILTYESFLFTKKGGVLVRQNCPSGSLSREVQRRTELVHIQACPKTAPSIPTSTTIVAFPIPGNSDACPFARPPFGLAEFGTGSLPAHPDQRINDPIPMNGLGNGVRRVGRVDVTVLGW